MEMFRRFAALSGKDSPVLSHLQARLLRWGRPPVIAALAGAALFIMLVLLPAIAPASSGGRAPLVPDTRLWYTAGEIAPALAALTPAQRRSVAAGHLTLDVLFPLVYGTLFAILLLKAWPENGVWKLALAVVTADLMENLSLAALYTLFPAGLDVLTPLAASWTALKWMLFTLMLLALAAGAFLRWRSR